MKSVIRSTASLERTGSSLTNLTLYVDYISITLVAIEPSADVFASPGQVCPRPERSYIAQIGLKELEEQVDRTAPVLQNMLAKWGLETLASKANSHFAHLRSPTAVTNCTLCRNSAVGSAALDWVTAITSTKPAAPIHSPLPRQTIRASGNPVGILRENTAEVSFEYPESP